MAAMSATVKDSAAAEKEKKPAKKSKKAK